ncbi:hypothetical protein RI129_011928 [Pyrocoelia pectoralis]|uniref:Uncharacterized protein n=1 Tax=Pyrocoelia pectoralis TaxID=417401 RepID=A0AAN7V6N7_9COLE
MRLEYTSLKFYAFKYCGCKPAVAFPMGLHQRSEEPEPTATVCYWKKATLSQVETNLKFKSREELRLFEWRQFCKERHRRTTSSLYIVSQLNLIKIILYTK